MLAILLISTKYKRVFSSIKYLVTNVRNCLKADIIKANKCLKFQYGYLKPKAFKQGVNPNVNNLYKEELTAKATVKAAAKKDSNIQSSVNQEAGKGGKQGQGNEGDKGDEDNEDDESQEEDKGNEEDTIEYIVVDD